MTSAARELLHTLRLEPLAGEGGYFRVTHRTAAASAIHYLLTPDNFSALHRIAQDELWHFHAGDRVEHVQLDAGRGGVQSQHLGADVLAGDTPQVFVRAGVWQGARWQPPHDGRQAVGYALLGCTVVPPWDERGFELAPADELRARFPSHHALIAALTR